MNGLKPFVNTVSNANSKGKKNAVEYGSDHGSFSYVGPGPLGQYRVT